LYKIIVKHHFDILLTGNGFIHTRISLHHAPGFIDLPPMPRQRWSQAIACSEDAPCVLWQRKVGHFMVSATKTNVAAVAAASGRLSLYYGAAASLQHSTGNKTRVRPKLACSVWHRHLQV